MKIGTKNREKRYISDTQILNWDRKRENDIWATLIWNSGPKSGKTSYQIKNWTGIAKNDTSATLVWKLGSELRKKHYCDILMKIDTTYQRHPYENRDQNREKHYQRHSNYKPGPKSGKRKISDTHMKNGTRIVKNHISVTPIWKSGPTSRKRHISDTHMKFGTEISKTVISATPTTKLQINV